MAQETITASIKPSTRRILEGKFVKEIMDKFDPNKHKNPNIKLKYEDTKDKKEKGIDSKTPLTPESIKAIKDYADELKDVKCFAVFTPEDRIEGIITPSDINEMQKIPDTEYGKKLLEDFTTDMMRLIKATSTQTLAEVQQSLADHKVLPVFEGENIVGFVYRDDVFKLLSSGS